jgi:hypothetical protein
LFEIEWTSNGKKKLVSRLNLRFEDEDPKNFAMRLQTAHELRLVFEETLVSVYGTVFD